MPAGSGGSAAGVATAVTAALLFGVSYNGVIAVQGMWSSEVFAQRPSAGLAAVSTGLTVGTLAGPAVGGAVIALAGYPAALVLAAAVTVVAVPLAPPRARPRPARTPATLEA